MINLDLSFLFFLFNRPFKAQKVYLLIYYHAAVYIVFIFNKLFLETEIILVIT